MAEELRIGDAEREQVVSKLRTAFGEGRLDEAELDERLTQAYSAKTGGDLVPLTQDLPAPTPPPVAVPSAAASLFAENRGVWVPPLAICALVTVIWLITTPFGYFWPVWVYFGMSIVVGTSLWAKSGFSRGD